MPALESLRPHVLVVAVVELVLVLLFVQIANSQIWRILDHLAARHSHTLADFDIFSHSYPVQSTFLTFLPTHSGTIQVESTFYRHRIGELLQV